MSSPTPEERAASRAEARRRARLAARGEAPLEEEIIEAEPEAPRRGGFLERLFPGAPPLPNRPDPLAKFDRRKPLRPLRERLYLLIRNPVAWVVPSFFCGVGYYTAETQAETVLGLVGTFMNFGSTIAAGWFGWQRPHLFGVVTALIGFALVWTVVILTVAQAGVGPAAFGGPLNVLGFLLVRGILQGVLGFVGGWYGGYLRRRQAQVSAQARGGQTTRRSR